MFSVVVVVSLMVKLSTAIVCLPGICDNITQPVLNCKGGILLKGGFCGCTDVCTKVEGETCQAERVFGITPEIPCDLGLHCVKQDHLGLGKGTCVKNPPDVDLGYHRHHQQKRDQKTLCEQMRLSSMISMVEFRGQWFAKCDADGNFIPMQCDNTKHCFCVDIKTGQVREGTKVLGTASCPPPTSP